MTVGPRIFPSKFNSWCRSCHKPIKVGDMVEWTPDVKGVLCINCAQLTAGLPRDNPQAGDSTIYWLVDKKPFRKGDVVRPGKEDIDLGYPEQVCVIDYGEGEVNGEKVWWADSVNAMTKGGGKGSIASAIV